MTMPMMPVTIPIRDPHLKALKHHLYLGPEVNHIPTALAIKSHPFLFLVQT
jgi:hypothetical protein